MIELGIEFQSLCASAAKGQQFHHETSTEVPVYYIRMHIKQRGGEAQASILPSLEAKQARDGGGRVERRRGVS